MAPDERDVSLEHVDRRIGAVAAEQHGVLTYDQLRTLGLGRGAIAHRVSRGLLHPLHIGVYCWGIASDSPWTRVGGAVLACGDSAFGSHHPVLGLYGLGPHPQGPVDVTVVGRRVRHAGIRAHKVHVVDRRDVRRLRGIPVTSPARTLVDVAAELASRDLAALVERAQIKRLVTKRELAATLERAGRRAGAPTLRALLAEPVFTRSEAERRLVALLRAAGLPQPAFNASVEGHEVDALWRHERVVLEFDSYAFHATRAAFERDRRRTATLTRARHVVLRTTWHELTRESHALVARTAEALALASAVTVTAPTEARR